MVVFWVSFGLGNLAKGPAPIPLVIVSVVFIRGDIQAMAAGAEAAARCGYVDFPCDNAAVADCRCAQRQLGHSDMEA